MHWVPVNVDMIARWHVKIGQMKNVIMMRRLAIFGLVKILKRSEPEHKQKRSKQASTINVRLIINMVCAV